MMSRWTWFVAGVLWLSGLPLSPQSAFALANELVSFKEPLLKRYFLIQPAVSIEKVR
jgi:hypothetical protein